LTNFISKFTDSYFMIIPETDRKKLNLLKFMKNIFILSSLFAVIVFLSFSCNSGKQTTSLPFKKPVISLMVWDDIAREGSDAAEFQLFQVGTVKNDLNVKYKISGTAKNGFDYRIRENIRMRNSHASLIIKPVDDFLTEGDESVIISLLPDSAYTIDSENESKTITIRDNELPDVQFQLPCSAVSESSPGNIKVILSQASTLPVKIEYSISGNLVQNSASDYKLSSGTLTIPSGSTVMNLPLKVINDNIAEDDETIVIEITKAINANIGLSEKHYYTIINDDGEVKRSSVYDKIYGIILGSRGGSSLGAVVEGVGEMNEIERLYGVFNEFLPCNHYDVFWSHPAGGTEDGIERQKCIATAIIEKQDRITASDLVKVWVRDFEMEDMYYMTQPYDKALMAYTKWGVPPEELPKTRYGMPDDLGYHIHLTARVFHPIPVINAGDPDGAVEDTKEIGRVYYEDKNDDAFVWGGVYNAALALAMLPGATVNSVIEGALKYATPEMRTEIGYGLAIADKYTDPMDKKFREELNAMYGDSASPYYANKRMTRYIGSSVYENVTCSFAIFKLTKGNVEQAVMVATNRGRDTDCTAASAGGLAGALTGTSTIPEEWIDKLETGMKNTPYSNSHMTNKATAQGLYRALQNKLRKLSEEVKTAETKYGKELPAEIAKKKKYLDLMIENGTL
jgi:ADP-ribosylglycohydrolase